MNSFFQQVFIEYCEKLCFSNILMNKMKIFTLEVQLHETDSKQQISKCIIFLKVVSDLEKENRVPGSSFVLQKQRGGWRHRARMALQKGCVDRLDAAKLCLPPNKAGPFLLRPRFFLESYLLPVHSQIHFKFASAPPISSFKFCVDI